MDFFEIYMDVIVNKIQDEVEKGDYASIYPGVTAPDTHEKLQIFGARSMTWV